MRLLSGLLTGAILGVAITSLRANEISSFDRIPVRISAISIKEDLTGAIRKEFGTGNDYSWKQTGNETDRKGGSHKRFVQLFQGYPVQDGMLILHQGKEGYTVTGVFIRFQTTGTIALPAFTEKEITDRFINPGQRDITGLTPGSFLWNNENGNYRLVYSQDYYPAGSLERQTMIVDASSMELICEKHTSCHADVNGTAVTAYHQTQSIPTFQNGSSFILKTTLRGQGIFTRNLNYQMNYQYVSEFSDNDNIWQQPALPGDQYATDAHYCAVRYYDFLNSEFSRNSLDNNGYPLLSYLNYGTAIANAFWNGQSVVYGSGNGSNGPLTTMDITGHEFTHGLIQKTAGLSYSGEPGTLNEAIADIFGVALEYNFNPQQANWTIGEQSGTTLRSFSNPGAHNQPSFYHGVNWYFGTGDQGGVHINSGFINKWFYLVANGEQGFNESGAFYNVSGIGIQPATEIVYHTLTSYLLPGSGFDDMRVYTIQSAIDLYGSCSPEYFSVINAWDAVGLGNSNVAPITVSNGTNSINPGDSILLSVPYYPGSNYTWYQNGILASSVNTAQLYVTVAGSWTVTVQRCNTTITSSTLVISQQTATSVETIVRPDKSQIMSVYPNPATSFVNINLPVTTMEEYFLSITDNNGKIVMKASIQSGITIIETQKLARGFYVVSVTGKNFNSKEKLIVN